MSLPRWLPGSLESAIFDLVVAYLSSLRCEPRAEDCFRPGGRCSAAIEVGATDSGVSRFGFDLLGHTLSRSRILSFFRAGNLFLDAWQRTVVEAI